MPFSRLLGILILCIIAHTSASQEISFRYRVDRMAIFHGDSQVSPYVFSELCEFSEGLTWAAKGELYGYVDSFGKEVIPFIYHDVRSFRHGLAFVSKDSGYHFGLINQKGDSLCPADYSQALAFQNGHAAVASDSLWGLLNQNGNLILDTLYDHPPVFTNERFIIVSKKSHFGVVSLDGEVLHPFVFDYISPYGEAWIGRDKYWLNLR